MTAPEVAALMQPGVKHPAWKHFLEAVEHVSYGQEALLAAWVWFRDGFEQGRRAQIAVEEEA